MARAPWPAAAMLKIRRTTSAFSGISAYFPFLTSIQAGQALTCKNLDDAQSNTWHTITGCKEPCNRGTGIAYPIANGARSFDSGQLGTNPPFGAPAIGSITWQTPKNLSPGTYTYFCRVHPFMRGSFRVKR